MHKKNTTLMTTGYPCIRKYDGTIATDLFETCSNKELTSTLFTP